MSAHAFSALKVRPCCSGAGLLDGLAANAEPISPLCIATAARAYFSHRSLPQFRVAVPFSLAARRGRLQPAPIAAVPHIVRAATSAKMIRIAASAVVATMSRVSIAGQGVAQGHFEDSAVRVLRPPIVRKGAVAVPLQSPLPRPTLFGVCRPNLAPSSALARAKDSALNRLQKINAAMSAALIGAGFGHSLAIASTQGANNA